MFQSVSVFGAWLHLSLSRLDIFRDHVAAIPRHRKLFFVDFYMRCTYTASESLLKLVGCGFSVWWCAVNFTGRKEEAEKLEKEVNLKE